MILVTPQTIAHTPGLQTYAITQPLDSGLPDTLLGFYYHASPGVTTLAIPYWFVALTFAVLAVTAASPWIPRRFSIRTLLIATTLVAVALAAIVIAAR
jgi:hypothetical protein